MGARVPTGISESNHHVASIQVYRAAEARLQTAKTDRQPAERVAWTERFLLPNYPLADYLRPEG